MMRSMAAVKSSIATASALRRVASRVASLTVLAVSAPVKPGVSAAIACGSTSLPSRAFFRCTARICTRPILSGRSTSTGGRSGRRAAAPGRESPAVVAASRTSPLEVSKPSISTSSWLSVCSFVVPAGQRPGTAGAAEGVQFVDEDDRRRPRAGLFEQVADPRGADADEHLDEPEPEMEKNGTFASPATARASRVLPVPGGPTSSTP